MTESPLMPPTRRIKWKLSEECANNVFSRPWNFSPMKILSPPDRAIFRPVQIIKANVSPNSGSSQNYAKNHLYVQKNHDGNFLDFTSILRLGKIEIKCEVLDWLIFLFFADFLFCPLSVEITENIWHLFWNSKAFRANAPSSVVFHFQVELFKDHKK